MRLAAVIAFVLLLVAMFATSRLGPGAWQRALYVTVLIATVFTMTLVSAVLETWLARHAAWGRAGVTLVAGAYAAWYAHAHKPGAVENLPFNDLVASTMSVVAVGAMAGALGFAVAVVRMKERGPAALAGVAGLLALLAVGPWLQH